jgi:hypothetical protein
VVLDTPRKKFIRRKAVVLMGSIDLIGICHAISNRLKKTRAGSREASPEHVDLDALRFKAIRDGCIRRADRGSFTAATVLSIVAVSLTLILIRGV